jgi:DNA-binding transcriptional regulator/RsmH inhibitor MraZ
MSKERKGFKQLQGIRGQRTGQYNNIRIDKTGRIYIVTELMKKANKHK